MRRARSGRVVLASALSFATVVLGSASIGLGTCGPFTDVAADQFCPFVLEIFYLGITTGTTPTTYDPASNVNRLQMATFLSRTVDGVLKRGARRAALGRFWSAQNASVLALTPLGPTPNEVRSDGVDLWVTDQTGTVSRVRGSDGMLLGTWTGAPGGFGLLTAMNRVFVASQTSPGVLYRIDPTQAPGAATVVASNLGNNSVGIAFDGSKIWTANILGASVSIVTPGASIPWTVTTVTTGFAAPVGPIFDGAHVWVTDFGEGKLLKLDSNGAILQTVTVGPGASEPVYDGANIWVPIGSAASVTVVRGSNGSVLATLTGNGLVSSPSVAAFDGERVLVTTYNGNQVSLWKAADLTPLGFIPTGPGTLPGGACSDGVSFWVALQGTGQLARF